MANKVIIGIVIILLILSGGLGAYSYRLNQQIGALGTQLSEYQTGQSAQFTALNNEVAALRGEALAGFNDLYAEIDGAFSSIGALQGDVDSLAEDIEEVDANLAKARMLEDDVRAISGEISQSVINAKTVYQGVINAAVRIGDGEKTAGSGFVFDSVGHVVTAYHVVERLSAIYVILADGRISKATVVGSCVYSDVAVLKLERNLALAPPKLADSDLVSIGEPVAVIGSPFDLAETLTSGIISQLNVFVDIEYASEARPVANLIQFDAAVNFGNSGGPLINSSGEVIGVVVARVNPGDGDGIYYAVSSNKVKRVADSLIANGSFDYPWLGVEITDLTPKFVMEKALETVNGVLVRRVLAGSPAQAGGIRADDVILVVDNVQIRNTAGLNAYLGEHKSPGEITSITLLRGNTKLQLSFELGKRQP